MSSLDVGCGSNPRGEVNVDLRLTRPMPENFVRADARYLPFKAKSFELVLAYNVLEHIPDYRRALDELLRVARERVVIRTDSLLNLSNYTTEGHLYFTYRRYFVPIPWPLRRVREFLWLKIRNGRLGRLGRWIERRLTDPCRRAGLFERWNYWIITKGRSYLSKEDPLGRPVAGANASNQRTL